MESSKSAPKDVANTKSKVEESAAAGTSQKINVEKTKTIPEKPKPSTQKAAPTGTLDWSKAKTKSASKDQSVGNTSKDTVKTDNNQGEPSTKVPIVSTFHLYLVLMYYALARGEAKIRSYLSAGLTDNCRT